MTFNFHVNIPKIREDGYLDGSDRVKLYERIIRSYSDSKKLDILEIGVFQASLSRYLATSLKSTINTYVGVDPYVGDDTDMYFRNYWKNDKAVADKTYEESSVKFAGFGGELNRKMSAEFLQDDERTFDVIIVDGDHREAACLADLRLSWPKLRSNGLLLCDDFANPDHPGVTSAAARFDREISDQRSDFGTDFTFFQKKGMRDLPYPLGVIWWKKG